MLRTSITIFTAPLFVFGSLTLHTDDRAQNPVLRVASLMY
jgi:hypothetical protein